MNAIQRPAPLRMTRDEFLAWEGDGIHKRHELVEGVVCAMSPASVIHGRISMRLGALLVFHLDAKRPDLSVTSEAALSPGERAELNVRIRDLIISTDVARVGQILAEDILFVAEALSPGNRKNTQEALRQYRTIPSVRDILLLHSQQVRAEISHCGPDGWPAEPTIVEPGGVARIASIGFACPIEAIYAQTSLAR